MSMASWTSPSASERILPTSAVTTVARSSLCSASSWPQRLTSAPRTGAGTSRQARNASDAAAMARSTSAGPCPTVWAMTSPVMGVRTGTSPASASVATPIASRARRVSVAMSVVDGKSLMPRP